MFFKTYIITLIFARDIRNHRDRDHVYFES